MLDIRHFSPKIPKLSGGGGLRPLDHWTEPASLRSAQVAPSLLHYFRASSMPEHAMYNVYLLYNDGLQRYIIVASDKVNTSFIASAMDR